MSCSIYCVFNNSVVSQSIRLCENYPNTIYNMVSLLIPTCCLSKRERTYLSVSALTRQRSGRERTYLSVLALTQQRSGRERGPT